MCVLDVSSPDLCRGGYYLDISLGVQLGKFLPQKTSVPN